MSEPFIGEIRMFGGSFAPAGWALCNGATIPISENDALFTLIGTTYGGDGQETFNLPDLQGRLPIHAGQGPGISQSYLLGERGGVESVTLTTNQIPNHTHALTASTAIANSNSPTNQVLAQSTQRALYTADAVTSNLAQNTLTVIGGSQPHENCMPSLVVTFIISLFGIFPSQT